MLITMNHVINTTKFRKLIFLKFIIFTLGNFETFAWGFCDVESSHCFWHFTAVYWLSLMQKFID